MRKRLYPSDHPSVALSLNNLAMLYQGQGKLAAAEPLYQQALAMRKRLYPSDHPSVALSLNNLAMLYQGQGKLVEAEPLYQQALAMRKRLFPTDHPDVAQSLNNLAVLLAATDRYCEALERMKEAAGIENRLISQLFTYSSDRDRLTYLQTIKGKFYGFLSLVYQHLSHSPEAIQAALDLVLQRKALSAAALAAFNQAISSGRYPHLQPELEKLRDLSAQIIHHTFTKPEPDRIRQLQAEHDTLQKKLASQVPEIQLQEQPINCRTIALELPEGSTLIEFVCFRVLDFHAINGEPKWQSARYLAFILPAGQPNRVQMRDLGEAEPLDRQIQDFRQFASNGLQAVHSLDMGSDDEDEDDNQPPPPEAIHLHAAIVNPLRPYLRESQHLILAPDGNFNLVPFQLLPTDETGERLLMDEYRISYLSTGREMLRPQVEGQRPASPALAIADPDFDLGLDPTPETDTLAGEELGEKSTAELLQTLTGTTFTRTTGTRLLGESVAQLLNISPHLGKDALATRLTTCQSPKILLIATHGYFSEERQEYWDLIRALLRCPNGEEAKLLQNNQKLLDQTLLEAMEETVAALLEAKYQNPANKLRNLATQLQETIHHPPQQSPIPHSQFPIPNSPFPISKTEDPMLRSALAFAGANTWLQGKPLPQDAGNGLVFAQDIAALDLWATELAVLSACQTGIGDIQLGEGVFGLRRAFAVAGAKTLVMSLWSVPDRASALLMDRFFANLRQGVGRADALQNAQNYLRNLTVRNLQQSELGQSVLKELPPQDNQDQKPLKHPFFWGAWICQGDTSAIANPALIP
jgi:CHAT domain-containing protein/tetratricopeptide (TPR) repeat protein